MKKIIHIEGMNCGHCQGKVEKALNALSGVEAKVNLSKKQAVATISGDVSDDTLRAAVTQAGFTATSIEEKKGLFGR